MGERDDDLRPLGAARRHGLPGRVFAGVEGGGGQAFETTFTSSFAIPKIPTLTPETVFTIVPGSLPSIGQASSPS